MSEVSEIAPALVAAAAPPLEQPTNNYSKSYLERIILIVWMDETTSNSLI